MPNTSKTIGAFPEDNYECTLSNELQKVALDELREESHLRQQAIESMRHFIEKQQHIVKCRLDSNYLLRFLRAKKFSIPTAQEALDKFISVRNRFPELMQNLDPEDPILSDMVNDGVLILLPEKDKLGRAVILIQMAVINPKKYTADNVLRLWVMTLEILLEDEYNQINGIAILALNEHATLAQAGMWTIPNLKKAILCWEKSMPVRNKGLVAYRAPSFIVTIVDLMKPLLSKKLAERINFRSTVEELAENYPSKQLPKELGGEKTMKEIIDEWKVTLKNKREMLLLLDQAFEVNENLRAKKDPYNLDDGVSGSFRKLEID